MSTPSASGAAGTAAKRDAALPPVPPGELGPVLERDLAATVASGVLSAARHGGVVIGVTRDGERAILTYGEGRADGVYEIGSVTKTLTGLLLAQMVEQGRVRLETPVRELLPAGTVARPASGREITLVDLSTQRSGLPRLPTNFAPADRRNPYAEYGVEKLYGFVAEHGVEAPEEPAFSYSNLGTGLLGQALANAAGSSYAALLREQITGPLGMGDTAIELTEELRRRFVQGYDWVHQPALPWDMNALAGAGGVRSSVQDMLTYLEAQLRPDRASAGAWPGGRTLAASLRASHTLRHEAGPGRQIALNWLHDDSGYWHNGGTGGFASYARFSPETGYALVILCNTAAFRFCEALAGHVWQRLGGEPAVSMVGW